MAIAKVADAVRLFNGHRVGRPQTATMRYHQRAINDAWQDYNRPENQLTPVTFLRRVSHQLVARFDQLLINRGQYTCYGEWVSVTETGLSVGIVKRA